MPISPVSPPELAPASCPIKTLAVPVLLFCAALAPIATLFAAVVKAHPAQYPIATLPLPAPPPLPMQVGDPNEYTPIAVLPFPVGWDASLRAVPIRSVPALAPPEEK